MSHAELIRVRVDGAAKTISFSREHINDSATAREIAGRVGELMEENGRFDGEDAFQTLNLDFTEIDWLSSAGLNQLIGINRQARSSGVRLVLTNVQQGVRDMFELTRLVRMFELQTPAVVTADSCEE